MIEPITFQASLYGIRTTIDGGIRITLDIPESSSSIVKELLDAKQKVLNCAIVPTDDF